MSIYCGVHAHLACPKCESGSSRFHEKALVGAFSVFVKLQASFPALHGVRVTMRGDMNGDSVCISGSGSGLHPRPCPGVWWPAQPGTTGQWAAAAPGPGHRTTRHLPNSRTRAAQ